MTAQPKPGQRVKLAVTEAARHRVYAGLSWDPRVPTSLAEKYQDAQQHGGSASDKINRIYAEKHKEEKMDPEEASLKNLTFDLDLTCYIYGVDGTFRRRVTPDAMGMIAEGNKIYHSGDDHDGAGDNEASADDERLYVELRDLNEEVGHIVFMVSSKNDYNLSQISGIDARIVDSKTEQDLLKTSIDPEEAQEKFNYCFAAIHRTDDGWLLSNIHEFMDDLSLNEMELALQKHALV